MRREYVLYLASLSCRSSLVVFFSFCFWIFLACHLFTVSGYLGMVCICLSTVFLPQGKSSFPSSLSLFFVYSFFSFFFAVPPCRFVPFYYYSTTPFLSSTRLDAVIAFQNRFPLPHDTDPMGLVLIHPSIHHSTTTFVAFMSS